MEDLIKDLRSKVDSKQVDQSILDFIEGMQERDQHWWSMSGRNVDKIQRNAFST